MEANLDILLGLQFGDEGKGKIVDYLVSTGDYDIVARFQGGANAGHTIYSNGKKIVLHQIPSGILTDGIVNIIGNGCVLDIQELLTEIKGLEAMGISVKDRLLISNRAQLLLPTHKALDIALEYVRTKETGSPIGSTGKGISPCYIDKISRKGFVLNDIFSHTFERDLRKSIEAQNWDIKALECSEYCVSDYSISKYLECVEELKKYQIRDTELYVNESMRYGNRRVLAEGAQGTMLDIDFGTYPYVTSSNTISGGVCAGLGVPPNSIHKIFGVTKAYSTRVGNGIFPTEITGEIEEHIRTVGAEFGATTGRKRRIGWLDIPQLNYAIMLNGVTDLIVTKVDILKSLDRVQVGKEYILGSGWRSRYASLSSLDNLESVDYEVFENFSYEQDLDRYLEFINASLESGISYVSYGVNREDIKEYEYSL